MQKFAVIWCVLWLCAFQLCAATADAPSIAAAHIKTAPRLDGSVDHDPAWAGIPASSGFTQTTPQEGQPASQRTEIRVAYTDDTLYFGIICFDDNPAAIVISDSRRDASLDESDSLRIILDTYLDGQSGFVFGTNPSGLEYDGQVSRGGEGGSGRGGSGGGFNINWDGVWQVETSSTENGWSAEFAVPFTTLRYPGDTVQRWGLNVQRNIRRHKETAYWAPLSRQFNLYRVSDAGHLNGLEVPGQRNLKMIPYVLADVSNVGDIGTGTDTEFGIDIKYSITPALTLDLTYNTDFAQVEVDEVQVNLDRFNLFFPEKRPFFLENAGQFSVGNPGDVELFFSRRIGISDDGEVLPIVGGARVSGKINHTNVGFLYMQTEDFGSAEPANDFMVARVNQDLANRSSLGAMYVNRESTGSFAVDGDDNQTLGMDGRWGIGRYGLISGFAAKTSTPGRNGDDYAYSVKAEYDSEAWLFNASYTEVREDFNPEVGFLKREAYRSPSALIFNRYRIKNSRFGLHEMRPHASYTAYYDFSGFKESSRLHVDNHIEWKNGAEFHTGIDFVHEGLLEPFEISTGIYVPPGSYNNQELVLSASSNEGAPLSFSLRTRIGGFFNGDRIQVSPTIRWRRGERFTSQLNWTRNDIDLPTGKFITDVGRIRLSYTLSSKSSLQALFQYNNVDDVWSTNLRYSWLRSSNTGLYIVYNDVRGFGGYDGAQPNRGLLIKYSHLFDVL